jgi:hypothetical protein
MQIFHQSANVIARSVLIGAAVLPFVLLGLTYVIMGSSYQTSQFVPRSQPIAFSHKHHAGELGIACLYCHSGAEKSAVAGVPVTEVCMTCHSQVWANAPMLAPDRESLANNKPVRWNRVHVLPDYAYFDHSIHVAKGVGCSTCHGRVDLMPLTYQAAPLTMDWCLDCHRNPAPNLRPASEIFNMKWEPPSGQEEQGHALLKAYGIQAAGLTECSVCHR